MNEFAAWAHTSYTEGLSASIRSDATWRALDLLGNSLAAVNSEPARIAHAVARSWGDGSEATAIGSNVRYPAAAAAFVNGTLGHALDFDDTHLPSIVHPSASVVPAALAAAEASGAIGAQALDAMAIGVELAVRLGMAGYDVERNVSVFFERGYHATSICGAIGASVAAALLAGLDADGVASAAGIASSMGAGILEANRTGGTVKRVHCGWAAHVGVSAASLARHGLTGPPTVFEGRFGLVSSHCGDGMDAGVTVAELGTRWHSDHIAFKPYPCNVFTHAIIDAAVALRADGVRAEDIRAIEVGGAEAALRTIAHPAEEKARPESGYHAAFSAPYTVASALIGGEGLGLSHGDFESGRLAEGLRMDLAAKVSCVVDETCDRLFPAQLPAVVRVTMTDGRVHEHRVDASRGSPANPLSEEELLTKFRGNLAFGNREKDTDVITGLVLDLASAHGVAGLLAALGGPGDTAGGALEAGGATGSESRA
nr:MmgE/PrpD family protein [Micromonospora sp. NBRC 107566]